MDSLERAGNHGPYAEKCGAFSRPVTAAAGPEFVASQDDQRNSAQLVTRCRLEIRHLITLVTRPPALAPADHTVAASQVRIGRARHDVMVAAAAHIGVERT